MDASLVARLLSYHTIVPYSVAYYDRFTFVCLRRTTKLSCLLPLIILSFLTPILAAIFQLVEESSRLFEESYRSNAKHHP
jgi:hypothetical protein